MIVQFAWSPEQADALAKVLLDWQRRARRDGVHVPRAARVPFADVVGWAAAASPGGRKVDGSAVAGAPSTPRAAFFPARGQLLSGREAARRLAVTPRTVRRRATSRGVGNLVGGRWTFTEADVEVLRDVRLRRREGAPDGRVGRDDAA